MGTVLLAVSALVAASSAAIAVHHRRASTTLLRVSVIGIWAAVVVAVTALIRTDTSYVLVADHTRPGLSAARRVMGLWGGSAGSLLIFTAIVATALTMAPALKHQRVAPPIVIAVLAATSAWLASPFERLDNPVIAGSGLSPILEHWAMLIHPPLLYVGLALSLIPGLSHPIPVPEWTRAAIATLTAALALGAGWAYVELGWGGWWAWDPVENTALIPWLLLVSSFHLPQRHRVSQWSLLAVWPVVFAGVALTRTSLRTSVHAFADAEVLGWTLWPLALGGAGFAIGIAYRFPTHDSVQRRMLVPSALLLVSSGVIALGTFRPFVPGDATEGWFYARFLFPVAIVGLLAMGFAPRWNENRKRLTLECLAGVGVGALWTAAAGWTLWSQIILGGAVTAGVVMTVLGHPLRSRRTVAHLGVMLVFAGVLGSTASTTTTVGLELGQTAEIDDVHITNRGVELVGQEPPVLEADLLLDDTHVLRPQIAFHADRGLRLPEVATHSQPGRDIQVVLRSADDDGSVLITVNHEPLTQLVWAGTALIVSAFYWPRFSRRARRSSLTVAVDA